jgi:hypothetical protein
MMETIRADLPGYPRCEERKRLVNACCTCMDLYLAQYFMQVNKRLPGKTYPDTEINRMTVQRSTQERIANAYVDSGAESWATVKALRDLILFRRAFANKLSGANKIDQDNFVAIFGLMFNLCEAIGYTHAWAQSAELAAARSVASIPRKKATKEIKGALKAHVSRTGSGKKDWPSLFMFEWNKIIREITRQRCALIYIVTNKQRSEKQTIEMFGRHLSLNENLCSREHLLKITENLKRIEKDLEFMQLDFQNKCGPAAADDDGDARRVEHTLFDFMYFRLISDIFAECASEYAQYLPSIPPPKTLEQEMPNVKAAERTVAKIEDAMPEVLQSELDQMIAAADSMQGQQEAGAEDKAADPAQPAPQEAAPAYAKPIKTFAEISALLKSAKTFFEQGDAELNTWQDQDESSTQQAQEKFQSALENFDALSRAMQDRGLRSIFDVDRPKLEKWVRNCESRIALCEHYPQMNGLRKSATKLFVDAEREREMQPFFSTLSGENGAIAAARAGFEQALEKITELAQLMKDTGVQSIHEVNRKTLEKSIRNCGDRIALCDRHLNGITSQPPEQDVVKKWRNMPGFQVRIIYDENALKKRGLVLLELVAPACEWNKLKIQRRSLSVHLHVPSMSFDELIELASTPDKLAEVIGKAHVKTEAERDNPLLDEERYRWHHITDMRFAAELMSMGLETTLQGSFIWPGAAGRKVTGGGAGGSERLAA